MSVFISAMHASTFISPTLTQNGAPSHSTTGEALVDLFFKSVRGCEKEDYLNLLRCAWTVSPLLTLKMIAHIRNIRGGKGERDLGRYALEWLSTEHPKHLLLNLEFYLGKFGRWDDGVHLVVNDNLEVVKGVYKVYTDQLQKDLSLLASETPTPTPTPTPSGGQGDNRRCQQGIVSPSPTPTGGQGGNRRCQQGIVSPSSMSIGDTIQKSDETQIKSRLSISLCAKWIPSEGKAEDRVYGFNRGLAQACGLTHKMLRMNLSMLRKKINILETHLCEDTLCEVDYSKVPSVAMNRHGKTEGVFMRRDTERFLEYKSSLVQGVTGVKVNVGALYPHEVVTKYLSNGSVCQPEDLTESQWKAILAKITPEERNHLSGLVPMVDVSGSMYHSTKKPAPIDVAISLGLLVSELNPCPSFHNTIMTFSSNPQFYRVEGDTLYTRVSNLRKAEWGTSTDFAKAFRMILDRAKFFKLIESEMPRTLLVISDMQFNSAGSMSETNYKVLEREYMEAGYKVPKLIFWNVNGSLTDFPVTACQSGTALISGFSIEILNDVLKGEEITPFRVMLRILEQPEYDCITLPDVG